MNDISHGTTFETAHARICELIDRFETYARDNYLQPEDSDYFNKINMLLIFRSKIHE